MNYTLSLKQSGNAVQFYLNNDYLGLVNHDDGYLSDFRAIVRKSKQSLEGDYYKSLKTAFFEMLNHYLRDYLFIDEADLQQIKTTIVKDNDEILKNFEMILGEAVIDD